MHFIYSISKVASKCSVTVIELLSDARRVARDSFSVIEYSALQLYYSVIPFLPTQSQLYRSYEHLGGHVIVLSGRQKTWPRYQLGAKSRADELLLDPIHTLQFSPDGTAIVSGSDDGTIVLRNAFTGEVIKELDAHDAAVLSLDFSLDGTWVASGSNDSTIRLWHAENFSPHKLLLGHAYGVSSVVFCNEGKKVASGSYDTTICIWDVVKGSLLFTLSGHTLGVTSLTFNSDDTQLLSVAEDEELGVWDTLNGTLIGRSPIIPRMNITVSLSSEVISLAYIPDNRICAWNIETGAAILLPDDDYSFRTMKDRRGLKTKVVYGENDSLACWIPHDVVPAKEVVHGKKMAIVAEDGRFLLLDFSQIT